MGRRKKPFNRLTAVPLARVLPRDGAPEDDPGDEVERLAESLTMEGLRAPILVKEMRRRDELQVIMGQRRLQAARALGWESVDALVLEAGLKEEIEALERLQAGSLTPLEVADQLRALKEKLDWTQAQLGLAIGRNRDFVANLLALTQIVPEARQVILARQHGGALTARHLRYVGRAAPGEQLAVAQRILGDGLSTTELERSRRVAVARAPVVRFAKVREVPRAGSGQYPKTMREWRRYFRRLTTDLGRLEQREEAERRRARRLVVEARHREQLVRREAARRRKELRRELREARKHLGLQPAR